MTAFEIFECSFSYSFKFFIKFKSLAGAHAETEQLNQAFK